MSDRPQSSLALDDQLCFALYAATRAMTARYRPILDTLGLTYPQYLVMIVLWDDGPSTVSQLGARLRLDSGTLSPLLKRLDARGLITRSRRIDDERAVEVGLTDAGQAMREQAEAVPGQISDLLGTIDHHALGRELRELEELLRAQ